MKLQLKLISAAVMASVISSSVMAAYGPAPASYSKKPCPWTASLGYGQSINMDKGSYAIVATPQSDSESVSRVVKLDDLKLYEADLFHCSGLGFVVMGTAKKAKMTGEPTTSPNDTAIEVGKYSFTAVMLGYQMNLGNNISARVAVGEADQKISGMSIAGLGASEIKHNNKMAANIEAKYHFKMNNNTTLFLAGGYLNLDDMHETIDVDGDGDGNTDVQTIIKQNASSGYVKLGVSFVM